MFDKFCLSLGYNGIVVSVSDKTAGVIAARGHLKEGIQAAIYAKVLKTKSQLFWISKIETDCALRL